MSDDNTTLSELMDRDPMQMSEQDICTIVDYMRSSRVKFNAGVKSAGKVKPAAKKAVAPADLPKISLGDLNL